MHELENWVNTNSAWIGIVTGVVGIPLAFLVPWWMRATIKPVWQLRSQTPLLMAGSNAPFVRVTNRQGLETRWPFLSVIRFGNRGKGELKAEAYDGPVRVTFEGRIVGVAIYDPLEIRTETEYEFDANVLTFKPFLLRRDEWFEMQVLTDGKPAMPELKVRVSGHKADVVEVFKQRYELWRFVQFFGIIMAFSSFIIGRMSGSEGAVFVGDSGFWIFMGLCIFAGFRKMKAPRWRNEPKVKYWK
ncbi:hypothetical protein [Arthrobacter sp. B2a2-09]|uniref:hypothetical protein n=1 Tax=Arthrobacter sp. B2a2-09 TaxID=2952822 RepID=UPI0022CD49A4|nr:hypothetical protein [Arthrobacter sp. B2a2-09]MCZ9880535.1 hypothetical protein [Arthrobacter sp. B2a2-09]